MPDEKTTVAESPEEPVAGAVCAIPAARLELPAICPTCGRSGTLLPVGEALFCAACGYASDSAAGCT